MFLMVAADRRRPRTMPCRSPFSKVAPALSMATSVPVPMAMPSRLATARAVVQLSPVSASGVADRNSVEPPQPKQGARNAGRSGGEWRAGGRGERLQLMDPYVTS